MAAAKAAVKFGSDVRAFTVSAIAFCGGGGPIFWDDWRPENCDWLYRAWPNRWGSRVAAAGLAVKGRWNGFCGDGLGRWSGLGLWVRSRVTVGKGAEAEIVAMVEAQGRRVRARKLGLMRVSELGIEPERSIWAAEEVVEAMAMAAGGNGWLWLPSYVVIRIVLSSAHLWTC